MTRSPPSKFFPPVELADADGLLLIGGELSTSWILDAYRNGIFPWPIFDDPELMAWWSPDPRAIFQFDQFHISKRLARTCRSKKFHVTVNRDFASVIHRCATIDDRCNATWLTPQMIHAYIKLHKMGIAHSVEVWHEDRLAGGTYGVSIGGLFAAESMFYEVRDASKVALVYLMSHLKASGHRLIDIQQLTEHTKRLGAFEIQREDFLQRLEFALAQSVTFGSKIVAPDWV